MGLYNLVFKGARTGSESDRVCCSAADPVVQHVARRPEVAIDIRPQFCHYNSLRLMATGLPQLMTIWSTKRAF